jgi:hypothetical protein
MTAIFHRAARTVPVRALATLALLIPAAAGAQEANVALVHRLLLDQQAVVQRPNQQPEIAQMGARLNNGDQVLTNANTRAAIRFTDDGSLIRLNPNSVLNVRTEGNREALTKTLELEFGELWARVTEQRGTFQVQTPSGVAAVKGTEFIVRVDAQGNTTVLTLEGAVDFFNGAGTVEVSAGNQAQAAGQNALAQVSDISDEDIEALGDLIEDKADDDIIRLEIPVQNADGVAQTLIIELPRSEAEAILNPGGGR